MSPDGSVKPSPEERLLKLIRGRPPKPAPGVAAPPTGAGGSALTAEALLRGSGRHWPQVAIVGLSLLLGIEGIYLIVQLATPAPSIHLPALPRHDMQMSGADGPPPASVPPALAEIPSLVVSASRPLFLSAAEPKAAAPDPNTRQGPSVEANQLAARLSLVGIVAGDPPQAILEDSQSRRTFFVTIGQGIIEGAVLEQVQGNRVILDLQGEKIELSL